MMTEDRDTINLIKAREAMQQDILLAHYTAPLFEKSLYWCAPGSHYKVIVERNNESEEFHYDVLPAAVRTYNEAKL